MKCERCEYDMKFSGVYWWCTSCGEVEYDPMEALKRMQKEPRDERHKSAYIN